MRSLELLRRVLDKLFGRKPEPCWLDQFSLTELDEERDDLIRKLASEHPSTRDWNILIGRLNRVHDARMRKLTDQSDPSEGGGIS